MSVPSRKRLLAKLKNKAYRTAYVAEHVKTTTPLQIRTVREQHEWTQGKLAAEAKTTQTAISRMEDPNYGNLTLNNLLKIAAALDVGLLVKLVPFSRLVKEYEDLSPASLATFSFTEECSVLDAWAANSDKTDMTHPDVTKPRLRLTSGAAEYYQSELPLNFQSPELDFPEPSPLIARDERRSSHVLTRRPLREAS